MAVDVCFFEKASKGYKALGPISRLEQDNILLRCTNRVHLRDQSPQITKVGSAMTDPQKSRASSNQQWYKHIASTEKAHNQRTILRRYLNTRFGSNRLKRTPFFSELSVVGLAISVILKRSRHLLVFHVAPPQAQHTCQGIVGETQSCHRSPR